MSEQVVFSIASKKAESKERAECKEMAGCEEKGGSEEKGDIASNLGGWHRAT
jgi:hypothetical protein